MAKSFPWNNYEVKVFRVVLFRYLYCISIISLTRSLKLFKIILTYGIKLYKPAIEFILYCQFSRINVYAMPNSGCVYLIRYFIQQHNPVIWSIFQVIYTKQKSGQKSSFCCCYKQTTVFFVVVKSVMHDDSCQAKVCIFTKHFFVLISNWNREIK